MIGKNYQNTNKYPESTFGWVETILRWFFSNVILGGFAVIVSFLAHLFSKGSEGLPNDFGFGLTILAIAVVIISTEPPDYSNNDSRKIQKWCRLIAIIIMVVGSVITFALTPSDLINKSSIDKALIDSFSYCLFISSVICGFIAYQDQLKGSDEYIQSIINSVRQECLSEYSNSEDQNVKTLKERSKNTNYSDVQL